MWRYSLTEVIKIKALIQYGCCPHNGKFKHQPEQRKTMWGYREATMCTLRQMSVSQEVRTGAKSSFPALKRSQSCWHLHFGLVASRCVRIQVFVCTLRAVMWCSLLLQQLWWMNKLGSHGSPGSWRVGQPGWLWSFTINIQIMTRLLNIIDGVRCIIFPWTSGAFQANANT